MTKKAKPSEVALGRPVVAWLLASEWDVYQEVQPQGGAVADIAAVRGEAVRVIELKTTLSFELLSQAIHWRHRATEVFVAVPYAKYSDGRAMARRVFKDYGIGIIEVHEPSHIEACGEDDPMGRVRIIEQGATHPDTDAAWFRDKLRPEHKTFAEAGSAKGGHFTEFKATCERIRAHVAANPGTTIRDVVAAIKHHYTTNASARAHLTKFVESGVIKGIVGKRDQTAAEFNALRLYPEGTTP